MYEILLINRSFCQFLLLRVQRTKNVSFSFYYLNHLAKKKNGVWNVSVFLHFIATNKYADILLHHSCWIFLFTCVFVCAVVWYENWFLVDRELDTSSKYDTAHFKCILIEWYCVCDMFCDAKHSKNAKQTPPFILNISYASNGWARQYHIATPHHNHYQVKIESVRVFRKRS